MGSICLSAAPILRCASLDNIQNVALIIPASLEVIASTTLVYLNWGSGKRHLLLTAEGWMYFVLALLELLSFIVPSIRDNLSVFRTLDSAIGIASFLPLFFYTFFLYLFTSGELTETLPNIIRKVAKVGMILFIPAIAIFNEVGSFVGVSIVQEPSGLLQYAFSTKGNEWLWFFFTSLSLAILVAFQATVFGFSLFRLVHTLVQHRRIATTGQGRRTAFNGVGWICAAAKLGALETVVGFAGGAFGVALTRRIMRLLARTCLYIGVVKGVNAVEDFDAIRSSFYHQPNEKSSTKKRTGLRPLISNPRLSTFRELSPTAHSFHAALKQTDLPYDGSNSPQRPGSHYLTYTQRQRLSQMPTAGSPGLSQNGMARFANLKERRNTQRVTVLYDLRDGPPSLHMRFSSLAMPSPALIVNQVKSRPTSRTWMTDLEAYAGDSPQFRNTPSPYSRNSNLFEDDTTSEEFLVPKPPFATEGDQRRRSNLSRDSTGSKSSTAPSQFEIVSASQLTLSQRRAETKLFLTRTPTPRSQLLLNRESPSNSLRGDSPSPSMKPSPPKIRIQGAIPYPSTSRRVSNASSAFAFDTNVQHPSTKHHMSDSSISLQGIQNLTNQFPRTPDTSRPPSFHMAITADPDWSELAQTQRRAPMTFWENDSSSIIDRDRAVSPGSAIVARAYGSPSQLMLSAGNIDKRASGISGISLAPSSVASWGNTRDPSLYDPVGPAYAYTPEPLDPFAPSPPPPPPSRTRSTNALSVITNPTLLETAQDLKNMWAHHPNESMTSFNDGERTPGTGFSGYTHFESGVVGVPEGRTIGGAGVGTGEDAECLGTGKSRMFKRNSGSESMVASMIGMPGPTSPASARLAVTFMEKEKENQGMDGQMKRQRSHSASDGSKTKSPKIKGLGSSSKVGGSSTQDRLSRVAESEGDDKSSLVLNDSRPPKTKTRSQPKANDLQNLHDRGTSIDQLAIHWVSPSTSLSNLPRLSGTATSKAATSKPKPTFPSFSQSSSSTTTTTTTTSSSSSSSSANPKRPQITRLKSVGAIQSAKPTPRPNLPSTRMRTESVHVHPIIIPPKAGDLPVVVQEGEDEDGDGDEEMSPIVIDETEREREREKKKELSHSRMFSMDAAAAADGVGMVGSVGTAASFSGRGILRDSEVLGVEDGLYVPVPLPGQIGQVGQVGQVSTIAMPGVNGRRKERNGNGKGGDYF
ncbi:hypothetical protein CPB83DRAFT_887841 [Crepidotus variabilis]|uniref:Uncharacterized protein n=1 Tax=Crepidotus variabilis TaxID=179855 RepID=A0A9P6E3C7_9AGAR|nr:hypothetical protein CPB83DRAFT_887841 [Crepidotus variabilis]